MGHPPWGSEHGLYVVDVDAGGALMGREQSNPHMGHEAGGSQLSMGMPWTHRRWRRVPERKGGVCFSHDPMPKRSATPRIALMNNNREAERALRGGLQWSTQPCIEFGIRPQARTEALDVTSHGRICFGNGSGCEQASGRSPLEPSLPIGS